MHKNVKSLNRINVLPLFFGHQCLLCSSDYFIPNIVESHHIQELGSNDAFNCSKLDTVLSEARKVEQWKMRCLDILGATDGEENALLNALLQVYSYDIPFFSPFRMGHILLYFDFGHNIFYIVQIKNNLDRSLNLYEKFKCCKPRSLCICCSSDIKDEGFATCSLCKDW